MNEKKKAPLVHIVKRPEVSLKQAVLIRAGAIVLAILACALVTFLLTGDDPVSVFKTIWEGSFGSERRIWVLLQNVSILDLEYIEWVFHLPNSGVPFMSRSTQKAAYGTSQCSFAA